MKLRDTLIALILPQSFFSTYRFSPTFLLSSSSLYTYSCRMHEVDWKFVRYINCCPMVKLEWKWDEKSELNWESYL